VLANLAAVLAADGRMLVGFALTGAPAGASREYPADEFVADAATAGLTVESRFASYDLRPFTGESQYAVHVLRHATAG
jgi:hypothetical protein